MLPELSNHNRYYNQHFPSFTRPKIIGFLSLDGKRQYQGNANQLKYAKNITNSNVNFDLNLHYEDTKFRLKNLNEKITHLLQFLLENEIRLSFPFANSIDTAIFFCYRGLMTCIASTPYENSEPWRIVATLHKGDIYLCALDTEEKIRQNADMSERQVLCTSWGYKFEHFLLSDAPNTEPNPNSGVDQNEEFSLVYLTNLNKHTIVYGAEMDGIIADETTQPLTSDMGVEESIQYLSNQTFIELKTSAHLEFKNQDRNFRRFKTRKWWLQSFLGGVNTIVCGFRNHDGVVEELKLFPLDGLAEMSKNFWQPNVCLNFLDAFLTYVKRCLTKEVTRKYGANALSNMKVLPLLSLHFEWSPNEWSPNDTVRATDAYSYDCDPILPEWFVNKYRSSVGT